MKTEEYLHVLTDQVRCKKMDYSRWNVHYEYCQFIMADSSFVCSYFVPISWTVL